jgi:hypothetical protein
MPKKWDSCVKKVALKYSNPYAICSKLRTPSKKKIYIGPLGGKYYISSSGNKVYI